ncbi:phosphatidylglycerol lysyltransferase domain-containing protein [Variovorax ginsengisoli]|uniref:Phosphatidylglycerol lysyltransferase domain-containing protein n=1 Tax=Variovorax ginsengisoli TaxID=363844 RepID=A0ABT8SCL7_9BURK|nr:phosphatidylglycerol lysyltransferase domain-containing protein [Variovorax ginsengisoli]MDN8616592.1 phosphatidylglycerol lysyltransferase domain-containing protein [Variovorax ginsengisoli]MDO1535762.1 phosphatidylglycerol lysyltransferase domain-containing protein [Variovorax ginsengisoli]
MSGLPLTLALQAPIEAALMRLREGSAEHCLSDHAFSNLYLFRQAHDYRYLPGDWPSISGRAYDGTRHLMPLFALHEAPLDVLRRLLDGHDCLYPIAQRHVDRLSPSQFRHWTSADDADYLFEARQFSDYPGRALARKRNQVRQLLATCVPRSVPFGVEAADAAREVLRGWMAQKGKAHGEADESACLEAIAEASTFGLEGFIHFEGDQPLGFVLAQELQPSVFVMRFAKGLDSHVGIYPYMFQHFCRSFARPVQWLNFEQDMGLPGFRRSKRSYGPAGLIPKLRVALRE